MRKNGDCCASAQLFPRLRRAVKAAFAGSGVTRTKVIAAVVRLIDVALLRPGYDEYARERGGRGASDVAEKGRCG